MLGGKASSPVSPPIFTVLPTGPASPRSRHHHLAALACSVVLAGFVLLGILPGCASAPRGELDVREAMARGRYHEAAEVAGRESDELLRHLDRGLALFYAGDHRGSNLYFGRAEHLADERYTRSLGKAALSLLVNDNVLPYQPDHWERLLVPLYRALNYVAAQEPADVAVEARRLSALLLERRDRDPERAGREGGAFLATLAGVLFEWAGRLEDARVAYRNAAEAYPAGWGGWPGHAAARVEEPGGSASARDGRGVASMGELVLLVEGGFVPAPLEEKVFLFLDGGDLDRARVDAVAAGAEVAKRYLARRRGWDFENASEAAYLLPIALRRRPMPVLALSSVTAEVDGRDLVMPVGLDLAGAAALEYEAELPALLAKTAARALVKSLLFKETTDEQGTIVRVLANALHLATERADTRAWLGLPAEIRFLRLPLSAGTHDLRLRFSSTTGVRTIEFPDLEVVPARPTIVTARFY